LLYTNDFAWALLILLGVDYWRNISEGNAPESKGSEGKRKIEPILITAAVLAIGFAPRWAVFIRELRTYLAWPYSVRFLFLNAGYHFYILFVSQSVAPWF